MADDPGGGEPSSEPRVEFSAGPADERGRATIRVTGLLTARQVAQAAGHPLESADGYVEPLVASRTLLRIYVPTATATGTADVPLFPGFQFDTLGRPLPVMRQLLARIPQGWTDEDITLWLAAPSGWLAARQPADLLATRPDAVLRALDLAAGAK